jgi:hypothetical protein
LNTDGTQDKACKFPMIMRHGNLNVPHCNHDFDGK